MVKLAGRILRSGWLNVVSLLGGVASLGLAVVHLLHDESLISAKQIIGLLMLSLLLRLVAGLYVDKPYTRL